MSTSNIPKGWHIAVDKKFATRKEALDAAAWHVDSDNDRLKVIKRGGKNAYYLMIRENRHS